MIQVSALLRMFLRALCINSGWVRESQFLRIREEMSVGDMYNDTEAI